MRIVDFQNIRKWNVIVNLRVYAVYTRVIRHEISKYTNRKVYWQIDFSNVVIL